MPKISLETTKKVVPMIYAYTTPGVTYHDGWIKIGYTEQNVDERIKQQTHTVGIRAKKEWQGNAVFDDGSNERFIDKDFHRYLRKKDYKQEKGENNEWFKIEPDVSKKEFNEFRSNKGIIDTLIDSISTYNLRDEQKDAVNETFIYMKNGINNTEFLWNCKPRFGKTLTVYDFMQKIDAHNVLIITNRPAIANSWYSDYVQFVGTEKYRFVSGVGALYGKKYLLKYKEFDDLRARTGNPDITRLIEFVSLQDLKGSKYFNGDYDKLKEIRDIEWDLLVIDEAHEGVDTYKTDVVLDRIKRKFTLHLSGTPFKQIATNKFDDNAIYNWTYADEQRKKKEWDYSKGENPYEVLPKLNMFTYRMSDIVKEEVEKGLTIDDEVEEYAFDLNEFFATNESGAFVHNEAVDKFLDALTTLEKFPFSTEELRNELKHTFWFLNRVDSAKALERKLKNHPVFKDYHVILAAGNGKKDEEAESKESFDKVRIGIKNHEKTITLSVGQLTTGVTIPEWTGVLMLCNLESPSLYMQAAFRAQNPCLFKDGVNAYRKENAYIFDFDPARTLIVYEQFANNLNKYTANGGGDSEIRKKNIKDLLNFFPVLGEDENGEMVELDAEKVLTVPRKIKSQEVVKRGFMSNFLFQNISSIFSAPKEVLDIINQFVPTGEPKSKKSKVEVPTDINVDENGNVVVEVGDAKDLFGEKIFGDVNTIVEDIINDVIKSNTVEDIYKAILTEKIVEPICQKIEQQYSNEIKNSDKKQIERTLKSNVDYTVRKIVDNFNANKKEIEAEKEKELENRFETGKSIKRIEKEYEEKTVKAAQEFKNAISKGTNELAQESCETALKIAEEKKQIRKKEGVEDSVRDHLRGFARTIPSFIMAYGNEDTTLENFDSIIPDDVFKEVTSISLDEFRFLRDGGDYIDEERNKRHFEGHLFEPVVFNDSIKEFLRKKDELADYFNDSADEDIFDYIPPQKTNQIYTPKKVVIEMVDLLEKENPGCFDEDDKTFADLYMKSGLYIAEIVKRLFRSKKMKEKYPDDNERLKHIFEKQVYGLAPTQIIYNIAKNFILGFDKNCIIKKHNLKMCDTLPYAENGTLEEKLDDIYSER